MHVTTARAVRQAERSGIAAGGHGLAGGRRVYCQPVLPSFTLTYQGCGNDTGRECHSSYAASKNATSNCIARR